VRWRLPDLDLVPGRWLHLTTQGLAFTDEISDDDVSAVGFSRTLNVVFSPDDLDAGPRPRVLRGCQRTRRKVSRTSPTTASGFS
jgi:hypothetical protein